MNKYILLILEGNLHAKRFRNVSHSKNLGSHDLCIQEARPISGPKLELTTHHLHVCKQLNAVLHLSGVGYRESSNLTKTFLPVCAHSCWKTC